MLNRFKTNDLLYAISSLCKDNTFNAKVFSKTQNSHSNTNQIHLTTKNLISLQIHSLILDEH